MIILYLRFIKPPLTILEDRTGWPHSEEKNIMDDFVEYTRMFCSFKMAKNIVNMIPKEIGRVSKCYDFCDKIAYHKNLGAKSKKDGGVCPPGTPAFWMYACFKSLHRFVFLSQKSLFLSKLLFLLKFQSGSNSVTMTTKCRYRAARADKNQEKLRPRGL